MVTLDQSVYVCALPICTIAFGFAATRYTSAATPLTLGFAALDAAAIAADAYVPSLVWIAAAFAAQCSIVAIVRSRDMARVRQWLAQARNGLPLDSPFEDPWTIAVGGPHRRNHHLRASDQRFACDLVRTDGDSFGARIVAPCAGTISVAHDGEPDLPPSANPNGRYERGKELGNYIVIASGGAFIFLCHLRRGSLLVAAGDAVERGTLLAACGNSGRTTHSHLHVHAQDRPEYALDEARGVAIRFTGVDAW